MLSIAGFSSAFANEPLDPVRDVIAVTIHNAAEAPLDQTYRDYFDPDSLMMHYSVTFTRDLLAAVMHAKEKHEQMFLDSEPITGGQDNCPLKDVTYESCVEKDGITPVTVQFFAFQCLGEDWAKVRSRVVFDVVREGRDAENAWYVIDDIRHVADDGRSESLRERFRLLARD